RHYELGYSPDADTQQPRLHSVNLFGRDGTAEATTAMPVATYGYGSASSGGKLEYQLATSTSSQFVQPFTASDSSVMPSAGVGFSTSVTVLDITGDGLPDNIRLDGGQLWSLRDWVAGTGTPDLLSDGILPNRPIETHTLQTPRYQGRTNIDQLWRQ